MRGMLKLWNRVAKKNHSRYPIPVKIQSQVGGVSEQPDLAEDVPAHSRMVGVMTFKGPF